ncbi:MAG: MFS transporter [Desulfovibrio sp.]|nr:MFS transporter [Desulfovibrio sp.]
MADATRRKNGTAVPARQQLTAETASPVNGESVSASCRASSAPAEEASKQGGANGADRPAASARARVATVVSLSFLIIMITMGTRLTVGLFVQPVMDGTGLGIAAVSMALAVGQLSWGIFQPVFGAWADKGNPFAALAAGMLCITAGQILTAQADDFWSLALAQGLLSPAGVAAGSFAGIFGIAVSRIPAHARSAAGGIINAGGSVGQFVYAPLIHLITHLRDYCMSLYMLAALALLGILPARALCGIRPLPEPAVGEAAAHAADVQEREGLREQLGVALRNPGYLLLNAGFFTCGFHVAFLITHLPGEISLCGHSAAVSAASISLIGLCNIAGSIGVGFLGRRFLLKNILAALYAARAVTIAVYLLAPKTEATFYVFACAVGFTWLATVPPTAGIVGKLFGKRYLATLFGLTFFSHQVGGFLGAWSGGLAVNGTGNFLWVWYADMALALLAAFVNIPIRERAGV